MTMVEHVARALHENSDSPNAWESLSVQAREYWRDQASAALRATRAFLAESEDVVAHFQAIATIDAALSEEGK